MPHNPLRDPRRSLGFASRALDDVIHGWPRGYWLERYLRADGLAPRAEDPLALDFPDLAGFVDPAADARLKVCIATEDFVGPVKNGGIGTTYTHLAYLLAAAGHDVTVAYLRGEHTEVDTIDRWVDFYAGHGIRFLPVPDTLPYRLVNAERWTRPALILLDFLERERFDLVHVSEWRGSGLYAQLARRLGLALHDTPIAVKTSSPWAWNRDYGLQPIANLPDVFKVGMERRSVELADMVIGGSAHLLRWMASQGYRLPQGRTFVQPNVVVMADHRGDAPGRGAHVVDGRIRELVFFGRLEARKGLDVFCEAVSLLDRDGLVDKVTFCGKPGIRLSSHPSIETPDYIREVTRAWRAEIAIHTDFDNEAVIAYLCRQPCIAVMPSLIENSSLAVYETTQYGIPFLASDVGGNAELIHPDDRDRVLFQPRPYPLYDKLVAVARDGLARARPSFDNAANLEVWRGFHRSPARWRDIATPVPAAPAPISVLVRIRHEGRSVAPLLASLGRQTHDGFELVLIADPELPLPKAEAAWLAARPDLAMVRVAVGRFESDAVAYRAGRAAARHPYLLLAYEGGELAEEAIGWLGRAAATAGLDVATGFFAEAAPVAQGGARIPTAVVTPPSDDASYAAFDPSVLKSDVLIATAAFDRLGGLTDEYKVGGGFGELALAANLHGLRCEVVPRILSYRRSLEEAEVATYREPQRELWRLLRPIADSVPQAFKPLVMGLVGIMPRFVALQERAGQTQREQALLLEQRDFWQARAAQSGAASAATQGAAAKPRFAPPSISLPHGFGGGLLDVADGVILGWAHDPDLAATTVTILHDGRPIGAATSNGALSRALALPGALKARGFAIDLGALYCEAREPFTVDVCAGRALRPIVAGLTIYPPGTTLAEVGHDGTCENHKAGLVRGWALRLDRPEAPVSVALYLDGMLWRMETANILRRDLADAGKGTGAHGFQAPVPLGTGPGPLTVEARLAGTGIRLRRGMLRIEGQTVSVVQP